MKEREALGDGDAVASGELMRALICHSLAILFCLLFSTSADAVPVSQTDVLRVDFSIDAGPIVNDNGSIAGYDVLRYVFRFQPAPQPHPLDTNEGWTVTAFDSSNVAVGASVFRNPFSGGGIGLSAGLTFDQPSQLLDSTGYLLFSEFVGTFEFETIEIELVFLRPPFAFGTRGPVEGIVSFVSVQEPPLCTLLGIGMLVALLAGRRRTQPNPALERTVDRRAPPACDTFSAVRVGCRSTRALGLMK